MSQRSNAQWQHDLKQDGMEVQYHAFQELGLYLHGRIYNYIRVRAATLPALASLDQQEQEALAADLIQDALQKIHSELEQFADDGRFLNWALAIALNRTRDEFRLKRWQTLRIVSPIDSHNTSKINRSDIALDMLIDTSDLPLDTQAQISEMYELIEQTIQDDLSPRQKRAFITHFFHGLSADEIAEQMETNRETIYQLIHQGRRKLKRRFEQSEYHLDDI